MKNIPRLPNKHPSTRGECLPPDKEGRGGFKELENTPSLLGNATPLEKRGIDSLQTRRAGEVLRNLKTPQNFTSLKEWQICLQFDGVETFRDRTCSVSKKRGNEENICS